MDRRRKILGLVLLDVSLGELSIHGILCGSRLLNSLPLRHFTPKFSLNHGFSLSLVFSIPKKCICSPDTLVANSNHSDNVLSALSAYIKRCH